MKSYRDLDVCEEARKLVSIVYASTQEYPKEEIYGIVSQMRRCAISIPSNIAEGCGRQSSKETIHFLYISRGSLYELETQSFLSKDLNFLSEEKLNKILEQIEACMKLLNGFINYYKKL
ncbi:four helix bundle protein [Seonamhaeicola algicola]|uniref:Four helix bundle protein n=1 Tax=Seonamhaeicola algicola TaxID=1719036 RepID=A0A5C7ATD5_9FLAO|nr:four helix bundle protein [Seonamhaeicola algicola]TXE09765.1 four helix bundle protein [Seonamhaeicola algicola]